MATYTLISSNVLTTSAANVTFSAIPSTYTDLVLRTSLRSSKSDNFHSTIYLQVNGLTSTIYSYTDVRGSGSGVNSVRGTSINQIEYRQSADGNTATANTFSSNEFYFANYTTSANKVVSEFGVQETDDSTSFMTINAGLIQTSSAISSIKIYEELGNSWLAGSSFYLYGISNA